MFIEEDIIKWYNNFVYLFYIQENIRKKIKGYIWWIKIGISLIVLIVTIIVVIILAAVVILTLSKNNPIESAKEARFKEDVRTFQDELALAVSKEYADAGGHRDEKITTADFDEIKRYIPSFSEKYRDKFVIQDDELRYTNQLDDIEKEYVQNLNIKEKQKLLPDEYEQNEYIYSLKKGEGILTNVKCSDVKKIVMDMKYTTNTDRFGAGFVMAATYDNSNASPVGLIQLNPNNYTINGLWTWNAISTVEEYSKYKKVTIDILRKYENGAYLKLLTWIDQRQELWELYSVIIYNENNEVIFKGIPCIEKSSGEYGVYDVVSKEFCKIK